MHATADCFCYRWTTSSVRCLDEMLAALVASAATASDPIGCAAPVERKLCTGWDDYRLSDAIRGLLVQQEASAHMQTWPNSLATSVLRERVRDPQPGGFGGAPGTVSAGDRANLEKLNVKLALRLLHDNSVRTPAGSGDWCVLHARVGDMLDCDDRSVGQLLRGDGAPTPAFATPGCPALSLAALDSSHHRAAAGDQNVNSWVRSVPSYDESLRNASFASQCSHVHIFAGASLGCSEGLSNEKSMRYLLELQQHVCSLGFSAELRLGQPPDEDFAAMVRAKAFIGAGGGWANLVAKMREQIHHEAPRQGQTIGKTRTRLHETRDEAAPASRHAAAAAALIPPM